MTRPIARREPLAAFAIAALTAVAGSTAARAASADRFPEKPITVIVPYTAGAATDVNTRRMVQWIAAATGWSFVVENKPGANGFIAAQAFVRAPQDGYTLMVTGTTTHAANPNLFKQLPYDPFNDFVPLTKLETVPQVLFAAPRHAPGSVQKLAELVKEHDGKLAFGTASETGRAASEMFLRHIGASAIRIPFPGSPAAFQNLIGGHVDFMFVDLSSAMGHIREKRLVPLAVAATRRLETLPQVPTMIESGFADFVHGSWSVAFAPNNLPAPVFEKLQREFARYASSDAAKQYMAERGGVIDGMSSAQAKAFVLAEHERYRKLFRALDIQPQ